MLPHSTDYIFPVCSGDSKGMKNVCGTAFGIGNNFFITANHVLENAKETDKQYLGEMEEKYTVAHEVTLNESFPEIDIAILYVPNLSCKLYQIDFRDIHPLNEIYSLGFPFGHDNAAKTVLTRFYKGYIISSYPNKNYNGNNCYELSFLCPRGISGAPLIYKDIIKGIILGNQTTEMNVQTLTEMTEDGTQKTVYHLSEMINYGIALQMSNLINIQSKLLGSTIGEFISKRK